MERNRKRDMCISITNMMWKRERKRNIYRGEKGGQR